MRSYQIVEWGQPIELREYPTPTPQGTEVLLRVTAAGICHSDLHINDGYFDLGDGKRVELGKLGATLPLTLGHEIVGVVEALGPDADGVEVGDARVAFPWIGCRQCRVCAREPEHWCLSPKFLGARVNGGYAEYVIVPHPKYLVEYDGIPTELACTYACAGLTAYSALKKLMPLEDDEYLVTIGAGGVGLSGVHIAPALTDAKLMVADVDPEKRAVARQAGAHETIDNSDPDAVAKVKELSQGGVKAVIDFVGAPGHRPVRPGRDAQGRHARRGRPVRRRAVVPDAVLPAARARDPRLLRRHARRAARGRRRSAAPARSRRSRSTCARSTPRPRRWPTCAPATSAAA